MSQATLSAGLYLNSNLFSGYYLDERVDGLDAWDCDGPAREAFEQLQELWGLEGGLVDSYNEDELLDSWIDEVLDVLGFGTLSETTLPNGDGYNDRLLFESEDTRRDAARRKKEGDADAMYGLASAILEAKQWNADFTERFSEYRSYRDASHQIKYYLERSPERVRWGVLTDGRKWRLYGTKDYATETYYEVDLPELLESGNLEAFKYFYVFFRPEAFEQTAGTSFLDTVWSESETAAQELGEDLQDNVFTALRVLGEGFVATNDLDIDPDDAAARDELKQQSLVLLYRLMFVLYAESRGLIHPDDPAAEAEYEENFSLTQLRSEIHDAIQSGDAFADYSEFATSMWSRLQDLFGLVDEGEQSLGIPPYNGGLFDDDAHAFLAEHEVADRYIAEVVYRLGTTEDETGEFVLADYADLDTRHLGTIYEGLLEHEFRIAPEQYAAVAEDGGQVWKPATEVSVADAVETVEEGGLYVVNDEGERKATGAYYTPDYVVAYIVEETVDPLVAEIKDDLAADGLDPSDGEYFFRFLEGIRDLRILDPAMGSGHFLTKATGYLTEQVMEVAREQEVGFGEDEIRRKIAKECIYGVDVNGMAVELAKLSMWLETLAADQPLAFLDHHLKTGNSLVGSDITEVLSNGEEEHGGQLTLMQAFDRTRKRTLDHVMDRMQELLEIDNENLEDIKSMEEIYADIRADPLYHRLFELANVHTAEQFGLDVPENAYERMAGAIEDEAEWAAIRDNDWFNTAQTMAEEAEFFHWELEFPEVVFAADGERKSNAGFDAVIGNPPWGAELGSDMDEYMSDQYSLSKSANDTFAVFTKLSSAISSPDGRLGYILPSGWQTSDKYLGFRQWLVSSHQIESIVNLPYDVFSDAYVDSSIFIFSDLAKSFDEIDSMEFEAQIINYDRKETVNSIKHTPSTISTVDYSRWFSDELDPEDSYEFISYLNSQELALEQKIAQKGIDLTEIADVQRGITPFDLVNDGGAGYSPALDGELRRYTYSFSGEKYVEYHEDISEFKSNRYFIGERLILRELISRQFRLQLVLTDEDFVTNKSYQSILVNDGRYNAGYLLGILNSTTVSHYHIKRSAVALRDDFPKIVLSETRSLPIHPINFDSDGLEIESVDPSTVDIEDGVVTINDARDSSEFAISDNTATHDLIALLARKSSEWFQEYNQYNLNIDDHLGNYQTGKNLSEIGYTQPPEGAADSILQETALEKPNLRIGTGTIERESNTTIEIRLTARYKPDVEENHETDRWGYVETDPLPALRLTDLSAEQADLIEAFAPVAIERGDGFANFRKTATKTNSLIDRLLVLTLPEIDDVRERLQNYNRIKTEAEALEKKIVQAEKVIDKIVYNLYDISSNEIELVEETVDSLPPSERSSE